VPDDADDDANDAAAGAFGVANDDDMLIASAV
jgi:hypothetical protein